MGINSDDISKMKSLYEDRFSKYGYDPKTLGWYKGKQKMRFSILTSKFVLEGRSILDIGCGFGDLNYFLKERCKKYIYTGVDCVGSLIDEARSRHPQKNINFILGDFLDLDIDDFDYVIASGIFNYKLTNEDNYKYIEDVIGKSYSLARVGLAFDFLSDRVDFLKYDQTFHSNPSRILDLAYSFSRNVILRNDYAPFEFSVFIQKDDSFDLDLTVFNSFKKENNVLF